MSNGRNDKFRDPGSDSPRRSSIDGALLFMDVVFALLHIPRPSGGTRPARKSTNYTDRKVLID
jgi:hypothetical protein